MKEINRLFVTINVETAIRDIAAIPHLKIANEITMTTEPGTITVEITKIVILEPRIDRPTMEIEEIIHMIGVHTGMSHIWEEEVIQIETVLVNKYIVY
jgi:hypothetical protein